MKCSRCGKETEKGHTFCPFCGYRLKRGLFEEIFSRFGRDISAMEKEMQEMGRHSERDFEAFDLSPFFRAPKGRGFTVRIVQRGGEQPHVTVQTLGDVNKEELEKQIMEQFRFGRPIKITLRPRGPKIAPEKREPIPERAALAPAPKVTEEPKTEVTRANSKVTVTMELPGVKSDKDIAVRDLEQSVEVKAIAGDKAYFKILTKPGQFRLARKVFTGGKLILEFA